MTRLVYDEFALMDACHRAADAATDGHQRALLAHRVGTAQRHIFDLESLLRDIGEQAVSYSGCVRRTLSSLRAPSPQSLLHSLQSGYRRALGRTDLPTPVQQLLVDNLGEYGDHAELRELAA